MGSFMNALMGNRTQPKAAQVDPATVGQPVPVAQMTEPPSDLTSGAAINQAAVGAWPTLLDGGIKYWNNGWRNSVLKEVSTEKVPGNYGSETSKSNFGFRFRAFAGIGDYATEGIKVPTRKEYNDLVPIQWGQRIPNPNIIPMSTAQTGPITIQTKPSTWQGSNTASLIRNGVTLL